MQSILKFLPFQRYGLAIAFLFVMQACVWAHAFLYYSVPKVGSTVTNSPPEIIICFTTPLDSHGSTIQVRNDKKKEVDKKDAHRDFKDASILKVSLPKLPPGTYKVFWKALSVDGHQTQGHFEFTLK